MNFLIGNSDMGKRKRVVESVVNVPNWSNRTIFEGDNLDVLHGMNSSCVDLVYLDPPFNSNRNYSAPIGSQAAGASFKDAWTVDDVDEAWHGEIAEREPALYRVIDSAELSHGKGMKSYLIFMAVRLLKMKRVLKETGSIYLRGVHNSPVSGLDVCYGSDWQAPYAIHNHRQL